MVDDEFDDYDDQSIGDYEMNGPDQITWSDLQRQENEDSYENGDSYEDFEVDSDYEDDDNRFAGLNSHGTDLFGRYGW